MRDRLIALIRRLMDLLRPDLADASDRERLWGWLVQGSFIFGVCVACLMALTTIPWWLELPAMAVLWAYGALCFLIYGTAGIAMLFLPFYMLWTAIRPEDEEAQAKREAREAREAGERALTKWKMIKLGMAEESDFEQPGQDTWFYGLELGWMNTALRAVTGVALIAAGHPVLAFVFLFPVIAMFLLDAMLWARQAWFPR